MWCAGREGGRGREERELREKEEGEGRGKGKEQTGEVEWRETTYPGP